MVKFWHIALSLIISAALLPGAVDAQEPESAQPRLLLMSAVQDEQFIIEHDLYRLAGDTWEPVTRDGYKGGFRLSPSGFMMVYQAVPDAVREAIEGGAGNWLAGAVWDLQLLDLTTDESRPIAAQPPTFAVTDDGQITDGITRSLPVWSPEGTALAWTEQDYPASGGTARLLTYDLVTGETRVLDESLPQVTMSANGLPTDLAWGASRLVVFTNDPQTGAETLRFYDAETGLQQAVPVVIESGEPWAPLSELMWVMIEGAGEQVVVQVLPFQWWRVEPETGTWFWFCSVLERVSASDPHQSLRLAWDTTMMKSFDDEWRIHSASGAELMVFPADQSPQVVLSPQGERVAYPEAAQIMIYDGSDFVPVEIPAGLSNPRLYWGWSEWRSTVPADFSCAIG